MPVHYTSKADKQQMSRSAHALHLPLGGVPSLVRFIVNRVCWLPSYHMTDTSFVPPALSG
jgi:hypothetical protein